MTANERRRRDNRLDPHHVRRSSLLAERRSLVTAQQQLARANASLPGSGQAADGSYADSVLVPGSEF